MNEDMEILEKDLITSEEEEEKNNKKYLIILIILLFLLFLSGALGIYFIINNYENKNNTINIGSVLFSYEEGNTSIGIFNAIPIPDKEGKELIKEGQYFDFIVAIGFKNSKAKKITYELSLIPRDDNTLDSKYVRIYLKENNQDVLINGESVLNFSDLIPSEKRLGAKLLLKKEIKSEKVNEYRFRMWLASNYELDEVARTFSCFVMINSY